MTIPPPAPRNPQPVRPPGGLHYSWVIVGILVVVQVIGSAISQSAGVMVAPLRDPHGPFGWGIGTIGAVIAVYYLVGALFAPVSGWLGERYGARRLMLAGGLLYGGSMLGSLVIPGIHNSMIFRANKECPYKSSWIL